MGWLPNSTFEKLRNNALALTEEQRKSLTWEEARKFVAEDTLELAAWSGLSRRKDLTPWQAVCWVRSIQQEELL